MASDRGRAPMMPKDVETGLRKLASIEVRTVADLKEAALPVLCQGLMNAVQTVADMAAKKDASDYTKLNAGNFLINVGKAFGLMDEVKTQRVVIASELAEINDDEDGEKTAAE